MAKFNMNDYAKFLDEEAKQERLQEELEYQRTEEAIEANANWRDWQEEQKSKEYEEYYYDVDWDDDDYEDYDYDYDDYEDDDYDPYDDLLDADVPRGPYSSLTADDLYDMYVYSSQYDDCCYPEDEDTFEDEDELDPFSDNPTGLIASEESIEFERINRKAVARKRHLNKIKEKKKAAQCSEILEGKFWKLCSDVWGYKKANYFRIHIEDVKKRNVTMELSDFRFNGEPHQLYCRGKAATKKVNRVKYA